MITVDALARELGCTISDLTDISGGLVSEHNEYIPVPDSYADEIRARWSEHTGIDYTVENEMIRETVLDHRVNSIHASTVPGVTLELDCQCGHRVSSSALVPEAARRRLWKSHALHVSTHLMTIGDEQ